MASPTQTPNEPESHQETTRKSLFGIESLEPRVLLSATLGNLFGADHSELESAAEALGDDIDLGDLKSEHDLFASNGSDEDAGFVRSFGRDIQAWFGFGDDEVGHVRAGQVGGLTILPNGAPEGQVDHFHVGYGETVLGNVLDNDVDPDGDPLSAALAVGPANGTIALNEDGSFEYVPDEGFFGLDRFWYQVDDDNGNTEQVEVCVFVDAPPNLVPEAHDDNFSTGYGEAVSGSLVGNDFDPDGDDFEANLLEGPQNGQVTIHPNGTFEYTPDEGFSGTDSFVYRIVDTDNGGAIAIASIDVAEPIGNEAPVTSVDHYHVRFDTLGTGNVLDNETDPDGDTLTASVDTEPEHGSLKLNEDGSFEYTPDEGWTGLDRFWYTVDDGNGHTERVEVCLVTDPPPNAMPDAVDDNFSTMANTPATGNVLANDVDPDDDEMTVTLFEEPENGTVTINPDGTFEYTPEEDFVGTDSFRYRVLDADGGGALAEVTIDVLERTTNEAPVTSVDHYHVSFDSTRAGNVLDNDSDPDGDELTATVATEPEHGTLVLNADGSFEYTPDEGWTGLDRFWYNVDDGNGHSERVEVCLVTDPPPNAMPDANKDEFTTLVGQTVRGNVLDNDVDPDNDDMTVSIFDEPEHGSVTINPDGTFEYTPDADFTGTDTFRYRVLDADGGGALAEVCIHVEENAVPDAVKDEFTTDEDNSVTANLLDNDADPDGDKLVAEAVTDLRTSEGGVVTLQADGSFEYTPAKGFVGEDTFTYVITDENGGYDAAEVCIKVVEVNESPQANKDEVKGEEGEILTGNVVLNDVDGDGDELAVELVSGPANGKLTLNTDGTFNFVPDEGWFGEESFEYKITDGKGGSSTASVCLVSTEIKYNQDYQGQGGNHWGDPHFVGDDGGKYDIQGEDGHIYNMISDKDLQYNARFVQWANPGTTVVDLAGILSGEDHIEIAPYAAPTVNGEVISVGEAIEIDGGTVHFDGNKTVTIVTTEYEMKFVSGTAKQIDFLNGYYTAKNPFADGVAAHGLWGQTVDADSDAREGDRGRGKQGGGAIDTIDSDGNIKLSDRGDLDSVRLYEVDDIFDTEAKYEAGNPFFRFGAKRGTGLNREDG